MSFRVAIRAVTVAALLLTVSCGGGSTKPPRAGSGPEHNSDAGSAIRFEDLPVTRIARDRVPTPNAANPTLGAERAPVVVQMWSDFECPYCADMQPVLQELLHEYAGKVKLVWHDYPLPFHAHARLAANAGREAYAEGGASSFWRFHDAIYGAPEGELDASALARFGEAAGLDRARFRDALTSRKHDQELEADASTGDALGVRGTPAFLVNDYFFVGAVPFEILRVIVDRALADTGA